MSLSTILCRRNRRFALKISNICWRRTSASHHRWAVGVHETDGSVQTSGTPRPGHVQNDDHAKETCGNHRYRRITVWRWLSPDAGVRLCDHVPQSDEQNDRGTYSSGLVGKRRSGASEWQTTRVPRSSLVHRELTRRKSTPVRERQPLGPSFRSSVRQSVRPSVYPSFRPSVCSSVRPSSRQLQGRIDSAFPLIPDYLRQDLSCMESPYFLPFRTIFPQDRRFSHSSLSVDFDRNNYCKRHHFAFLATILHFCGS